MRVFQITVLTLALIQTAYADEGMWLFNQPPRQILHDRYQFDATDQWLDHVQKSSIRLSSGGSGSFVSADGLLITNHHVGAEALQQLSTADKNYVELGFHAAALADELKCFNMELNVLQSIEDVTARVNAAVPPSADAGAAFLARRKVIAEIEKESLDKTGLRSDVVTLWEGGAYHIYCYKRYTDVRLVFAPQQQAAFFGGDPDNFEFPRFDLDICLFRAYEDGKPAKITDYLRFSPTGPKEGDLIFVSGHPGGSDRLLTMSELQSQRDLYVPMRLDSMKQMEVNLLSWSDRNEENARRARDYLFGIQNGRKLFNGRLAGLLDPQLMESKSQAESDFRAKLTSYPDAQTAYSTIDKATQILIAQHMRRWLFEGSRAFECDSFDIARTLLRAGDERPKPNGERLREFADSKKASLELDLFSDQPIYPDLEIVSFSDSLTFMVTQIGINDPLVQKILAGKSPHDRAVELINNTKVRDVAFRHQLYDGGATAVKAANDPLIELARTVDAESRALRKVSEEQDEAKQEAHAAIAHARNALLGTSGYPDATFTLRLAFGTVKGYEEDGAPVPAMTTLAGLYQRSAEMHNRVPFDLPEIWQQRKATLDLNTPMNFVSTADIIGGNSGSPVINRAGEFVGIIFDGNLASLSGDYAYSDKQSRAVSVHSAAILEALNKVYDAKPIADELLAGHR